MSNTADSIRYSDDQLAAVLATLDARSLPKPKTASPRPSLGRSPR